MKEFTGKTIDECVQLASEELGVTPRELVYEVVEEKKGLFKKTAKISVYEKEDAAAYGEEYLRKAISALGIEVTVTSVPIAMTETCSLPSYCRVSDGS